MRCSVGYFHCFDPDTHRCRCGRWQNGYAPKKEAPRYGTAECQVCENQQAQSKSGRMVLHGYRRPGVGYAVGRCPGYGHKPFPETDALEAYVPGLERHIKQVKRFLAGLHQQDSVTLQRSRWDRVRNEKVGYEIEVKRGAKADYSPGHSAPSFEDAMREVEGIANRDYLQTRRELKRVTDRIAKGKAIREQAAAPVGSVSGGTK
jgi:hypothetical protein